MEIGSECASEKRKHIWQQRTDQNFACRISKVKAGSQPTKKQPPEFSRLLMSLLTIPSACASAEMRLAVTI